MKKITIISLGFILLGSTILFADNNNHMGDHMHDGKMQNHANEMHMTNEQMQHMSMTQNKNVYHNQIITNDYKVTVSSKKPLVSGNNPIAITIEKDNKVLTNAKVKAKFFMPQMPGMPYMEYKTKCALKKKKFHCNINLSMGGTWQYQIKFKTSDGKIHKIRGSVNI